MQNCLIQTSKPIVDRIRKMYAKRSRKDFTEHYLYIVNTVLWQHLINKKYSYESFVPLNMSVVRTIVSDRERVQIMRDLKDWGILESDNQYIAGVKSKGYRICNEFRHKLTSYKLTDKILIKKINKYREMESIDIQGDYLRSLKEVCIDKARALKYIRNHYNVSTEDYASRFMSINLIHDQQFFAKRDKYGRVHTNLTNLAGDLRQFLYRNTGELLQEVDIKNSQPLFLYCALQDAETIDKEELDRYGKLVLSGEFYERLNDAGIPREVFKKQLFTEVLFGKNQPWIGPVAKRFSASFPSIWSYIRKQKEIDHNRIAIMLQREESKFVIDGCVRKVFVENNYDFCLSIHDSLVVVDGQQEMAAEVMSLLFKRVYGIDVQPKFK